MSATWRTLLAGASERLGSDVDARRIVERVTGAGGSVLFSVLDQGAPVGSVELFDALVERRAAGEPLQYVVGRWAFRSLDLLVDRRVLIPRPETEQVVEVARAELARLGGLRGGEALAAADMGTGSGAIALSLADEIPGLRVWATDRCEAALAVARANLAALGARVAARVTIAFGSWYDALPVELAGLLDLIVSNPPYVAESEVADLPLEVAAWEPRRALVAGATGMEAVAAVLEGAPRWLARPGAAVIEIAPHQAGAAAELARRSGFREVEVCPDLAGRQRVLVARL